MEKKEVLGFIPARGGSKGIPGKNLTDLGGKPLLWYTIFTTLKSKFVSRCVVSTDNNDIASYCKSFGIEVINRPDELANDTAIVTDAINYTLGFLREKDNYNPDIVVNLNPTSPFRKTETIDKAINKLVNQDYDSVFSGILARFSPYGYWNLKEDSSLASCYDYYSLKRRQDLNKDLSVIENGGVYAIETKEFYKKLSLIGKKPGFVISLFEESVDINNYSDLHRAEIIYEELFKDYFQGN